MAPCLILAARTVLCMSMAMVIGPTPPGTGVMSAAFGATVPKAFLFETGRNEWHRFDSWPPKNAAARTSMNWALLYFPISFSALVNRPLTSGFISEDPAFALPAPETAV